MNKTDRKNKVGLTINWPTIGECFTFKDLVVLNPTFKEITLRVRLDNAIKIDKKFAIIGYKKSPKGRPQMLLSMNPISQSLLDTVAEQADVMPPITVPVINIMSSDSLNEVEPIITTTQREDIVESTVMESVKS